jgi:hypothetical protein
MHAERLLFSSTTGIADMSHSGICCYIRKEVRVESIIKPLIIINRLIC